MPRKRLEQNRGLPPRWRRTHGAYYFCVPPGQEARWDNKQTFRLGKTLAEAHRTWAKRVEFVSDARTVGGLLDRYQLEVLPLKAPKTQREQAHQIVRLKAVFGAMPIRDFRPIHAYQYRDRRGKKTPTAANRELEILSHAFTKAIEWGYCESHPMIEGRFRKLPTPPRTRYVQDWEILEVLSLSPRRLKGSVRMIQAYIGLKLLTGRRRSELLRLKLADLRDDGIRFMVTKTAKKTGEREVIIEWTDALRQAVEEVKAARPAVHSDWVFCTSRGAAYLKEDGTANGWDNLWQRFMKRVLKETKVKERFTEHDLRAKCASDAESLERARALLAHASANTTHRIYRRAPDRVKPLR